MQRNAAPLPAAGLNWAVPRRTLLSPDVVNRTSYTSDRPIRLTRYIYRADPVRLLHVEGKIPADYRHD